MYAIPMRAAWGRQMPDRIGPQFPGPGDRERLGSIARYDEMASVPYIPLRDWRLPSLLARAQRAFDMVTR